MPTSNRQQSPKKKLLDQYARFSAMGMQMGAVIFVCIYSGMKLDEYLHWEFPVFTLAGSFIGVAGAIYSVIRQLGKNQ